MNKYLSLFVLLIFFTGCKQNTQVYMHELDGKWISKDRQVYAFEIKDAQNPKNIIFVVRNNNDYPYSNIRFFSRLYDDPRKINSTVDTLNYMMAKPNGEWLGSGFGDTKEIWLMYKKSYTFPRNGKYYIDVTQAMRKQNLPGIEDLGIKIEQAQP